MVRSQIIEYLEGFKLAVNAPVREGVEVLSITSRTERGFYVATSMGAFTANQIVIASGGYDIPIIPRMAERLPTDIVQLHSAQYRNADALPAGGVLVVGSGQSGAQLAEDLHLSGRKVFLAVGEPPRCARFYRGRDVVDWLADMNYYDMSVDKHPLREGVRDNTNHYVTGRGGGRDIDLRQFALEGMELFGRLEDMQDGALKFAPNLRRNLDSADKTYNGINAAIDKHIQSHGISAEPASVYQAVWQPARARIDLRRVQSRHYVGALVYRIPNRFQLHRRPSIRWPRLSRPSARRDPRAGVIFSWSAVAYTWGSGRFSGIARDAGYLVERIKDRATGRKGMAVPAVA